MRTDKRSSQKPDKKLPSRMHKRGIVGYSKKSALLEEAITQMNTGKYGRSSAALKELLALDPQNIEARHLFATLHLRLGSLVTARQAFESLANEAIGRQDYWLAESLLREYLAAGPRCVPFLEQLAQVYQEKGDEMAAVVELGKPSRFCGTIPTQTIHRRLHNSTQKSVNWLPQVPSRFSSLHCLTYRPVSCLSPRPLLPLHPRRISLLPLMLSCRRQMVRLKLSSTLCRRSCHGRCPKNRQRRKKRKPTFLKFLRRRRPRRFPY